MRNRRGALALAGPALGAAGLTAQAPAATPVPADPLYQVRPGDIWRYLKTQPASFWLVCIYLFLEYVRPQTIYPALSAVPWSMLVLVGCLLAFLLEKRRRRPWTVVDTGMVVYTGVVLLSSLTAWDPAYSFSYTSLTHFHVWALVYVLVSNIVNTERRFLVFMLSFLLYNLKMAQHAARAWAGLGFGFSQWAAVGAPGWFHNPGELGIEMAIFMPISYAFYMGLKPHWNRPRRWVFVALPVLALMAAAATSSRGSQLGMAAVGLWLLFKSRYKVRGVVVALAITALVYVALPQTQKDRFSAMGDDETSQTRLTYWKHGIRIAAAHPVLGIGYRNWLPYYQANYNPLGQLPHNIFVEAGAELGYTGLAALVFLIGGTFWVNHKTRRLAHRQGERGRPFWYMAHGLDGALIGFMVGGFFVTVLYYPFFWVNLAMTVSLHAVTKRELGAPSGAGGGNSSRVSLDRRGPR